jgi:tight adherence protein B
MLSLSSLHISAGQAILIFGLTVLGILLAVNGLFGLVSEGRRRAEGRINRRLEMLARGTDPKAVLDALRRTADLKPGWMRFVPAADWMADSLRQAGMTITLGRFVLAMAAGTLVLTSILKLAGFPLAMAVMLALMLAVGLPLFGLTRRRQKRLKKFAEQLPDAIDMLVRSLRVGHPLSAACQMVAEELPDPIGTEFGIAVDEMTYGLDLNEAIQNLGDRLDVPDLQYLTVAVNVQYGTGGNLAEILHGLGKVIRDRFHMYRKIRAVSAEGRMASVFLTIFPFVVVAGIWVLHKDYYRSVSDHPLFHMLAGVGAVLVILNTVVMRWLTNIKV